MTTGQPKHRQTLAWVLFTAVFFLPGVLFGEDVITMGYGSGSPGDTGVDVVITATNDTSIHGYSVAFTYPTNVLSLTSVSTTGTHIAAILPDFVAPSFDNQLGVGNMGVIFSYTEPVTLKELRPLTEGAYPRIIARLVFSVKADAVGGVYPLKLVNGIGNPASFNRFSNRGTSIAPRLVNGSFRVARGNALMLEQKLAFAGATPNLEILSLAQHPDTLNGFQTAFTYDKNALECKAGTFTGTTLGFLIGSRIEAFKFTIDLNYSTDLARATVATLFDMAPPLDPTLVLPPSMNSPPNQSLIKFTFNVKNEADDVQQYQDLLLMDTGIPGDIDNRFIVGDRSLDPELISGKVYFSQGNLKGKVVDSLTMNGVPGVTVTTEPDGHTTTTSSAGNFSLDGISPGKYALLLSKDGYYRNRVDKTSDGTSDIIVAGNSQDTNIGYVPIYKIPASIVTPPFIRAFINSDNRNDLSDAIFLLQHLFLGQTAPQCTLAADTNDDEKMDLSDAIWLLSYLFVGGAEPPPPFSPQGIECGQDPTPGPLDCEFFNCP